ncbi:hypothetical protein [Streptomyces thermolilacinus]|uniref:hypothetical protein n=1 Tax=Streptomyces thermolilacinus TaxID=285540 RepID=UPI0033C18F49
MRVRDDLATMFCKRVATKIKKAKAELEEIRLAEREIVEALIGNYRTVLKHIEALQADGVRTRYPAGSVRPEA